MRTFVCLGILLLGVAGCAAIPDAVRIEIDGASVAFKKKPDPAAPVQPAPDAPQP